MTELCTPQIKLTIISTRESKLPCFMIDFISAVGSFKFIMPDGQPPAEWKMLADAAASGTNYGVYWGNCSIEVAPTVTQFVSTGESYISGLPHPFQASFTVSAADCVALFTRMSEETIKW